MAEKNSKQVVSKVKIGKPKNGVQFSQSELYDCIKDVCKLDSRRIAKDVYTGFANLVQASLKKGYKVALPGIGKIQVRQTKPRMGRNPATGEVIKISARRRVRLTPSKALKQAVL